MQSAQVAALIESRRDTLALRRRIGGEVGWDADLADAGARGGGGGLLVHGGGSRGGGSGVGGGAVVVAVPNSVGPARRTAETDFVGGVGGGFAYRDTDTAAAAAAAAAAGGRYASSDGDAGSELFGSVDSDGLPFLLRAAAGEADGPGGWDGERDDGGERARLHMESVRQVRFFRPKLG